MKDFRQLKVWGESASCEPGDLPSHRALSPCRGVWFDLPNPSRRCIHRRQSGRGLRSRGDAEFGRFCGIARGSASELEYRLLLAKDLGLLTAVEYHKLAEQTTEIKRMLTAPIQKLNAESRPLRACA